jgi:hypothetical protein
MLHLKTNILAMRKLYALFLFAWLALSIFYTPPETQAQTLTPRWDSRLGSAGTDSLTFILQTADGGYLIGGSSNSNAGSDKSQNRRGNYDYWVARLRPDGSRLWDRTFGGTNEDFLTTAVRYQNGYLLLGQSNSNSNGDKTVLNKGGFDIWVVYIDDLGNKIWDRAYGGSGNESVAGAFPQGNNFIIAGSSASNVSGDKSQPSRGGMDFWIVKIDPNGIKLEDLTFGGSADDIATCVSDGTGAIIGGNSFSGVSGDKTSPNRGGSDYWLIRLNRTSPTLAVDFQGNAGGSADDRLASVTRLRNDGNNGRWLAVGASNSPISGDKTQASLGDYDYWLVHFNSNWQVVNQRVLGTSSRDWPVASDSITCKGQAYLAGISFGGINGNKTTDQVGASDLWVMKINAQLNPIFDRSYGGPGTTFAADFEITADGGFVTGATITGNAGGNVSGPSRGVQDYWVTKYDVRYPRGTVSANATVCATGNTGLLQLNNATEPIAGWERSLMPNFVNRTFIDHRLDTLRYTNLTQTTYYRALTYNDKCGLIPSDSVEIRVVFPPVPVNVGMDDTICLSPNFYTRIMPTPSFGTGSWRQLSGPALGANQSNRDSLKVRFAVAGEYYFIYEVVNPPCPSRADTFMVWVQAPSHGGTISASATTICSGTAVTLTLNNYTGTSFQWERQPDCMGAFTAINGATQPTLQTPPLQDTVCYRVRVQNGVCSATFSDTITINVGFLQQGQLAPPMSVCTGQNSGTLLLTGNSGTVVRWESAPDSAFTNITTIARTLTNYTFSNLTRTTWYRVVLTSPECQQGYSRVVKVTVGQTTVGGTVTGPVLVCSGQPFNPLVLSGHVGDVLFWEKSINGGQTWTSVSATTTTLNVSPLTQTTAFRAVVQSPGCLIRRSQQVTITVQPGPVAGTLGTPRTFCSGQNSGTLVLSGFSGNIVRWERSTDGFATIQAIANTLNTQNYANLTETTCYRVVVTRAACQNVQLLSNVVCITITPPTNGGTITGPQNGICVGQPVNDTLRLTNYQGSVIRWERSTNNFVNITTISNTTDRLAIPNNLTQNTQYRAVVRSGQCAQAFSSVFNVTVSQPTVGGTLTPPQTVVCRGGNGQLALSGHNGSVIRWESSEDGFQTFTTISNTTSSFAYFGLNRSTCYRAVVKNGTCPEAFSSIACVTVDTTAGGGRVVQDATVCYGVNGSTLALTNYQGQILRWESSTNNFQTLTTIANSLPVYTYSNLTQTTQFRAIVQNGNCNGASMPATITVLPQAQGGFIGGGQTVCAFNNQGALILTGHGGQVAYWESSTDNFQNNFTQIGNNTTVQNYAGLSRTTCYRAYVRSGPNCLPVASQAGCITVAPQDTAYAGQDRRICGDSTTLVGNIPNGGIGVWSIVSAPNGANPSFLPNGNNRVHVIAMFIPGTYCFIYTIINQNNPFCPVDQDTVCVTVSLPTNARIITRDTSLCVTDSLRLNASGNGNFMWQFMNGQGTLSSHTSPNPTVRNLAYGVNRIFLVVTDPNQACPPSIDTITITRDRETPIGQLISLSGDSVCVGQPAQLYYSSNGGTIVRWERSPDNFQTHTVIPNSQNQIQISDNFNGYMCYRVVVRNGSCPEMMTSPRCIITRPQPVRGQMFGDTTVCAASYGGVMELRNHTGNIIRWESSYDNFQTATSISNTSRFHQFGTTRSICFRALLQSANCPPAFSDTGCVSVGGGVPAIVTTPDTVVCTGTNQGVVTASGFTGNIIRWEVSSNGGQTWSAVSNVSSFQNFANLTQRTCIRVVTQFNTCAEQFSNIVCVNVNSQTIGGILTSSQSVVCSGGNVTINLSGHVGNVIGWERSDDCNFSNITSINNFTTTLNATPTQTSCYRAVVKNGACPPAFSAPTLITVVPGPQAGVIIGRNTVCGGGVDSLRLVQYQGQVVRWEVGLDPSFVNRTEVNNTSDQFVLTVPNQQVVYVRALVTNGNCTSYSQVFTIIITPGLSAPVVSQSQTNVCFNQPAILRASGNPNGTGRYYWYDANNNLISDPNGVFDNAPVATPRITVNNTCFFAEYREGTCVSPRKQHCVTFNPNMPTMPTFPRLDSVVCLGTPAVVRPLSINADAYLYYDANMNLIGQVNNPGERTFNLQTAGVYTFYVQGFNTAISCPGPLREFRIRVGGGQDGGQLTGPQTACVGQNVTLVLQNHVGQIIRWESSTDNFATVNTISNFSSVLNVPNIPRTIAYRAVVQGCGFHLSNVHIVSVGACNPSITTTNNVVNRCRLNLDTVRVAGTRTVFNDYTNIYLSASPTSITNPNYIITDVELVSDVFMKFTVPFNIPNGTYFVIVQNGDGFNNDTWPEAVNGRVTISGGPCEFGRLSLVQPNQVNTCQNPLITVTGDTTTFGSLTNVWLSTSNTSIQGNNLAIVDEIVDDRTVNIRVPRSVPSGTYWIIVENGGRSRPNFNFPVPIQITIDSPQCPDGVITRTNPPTVNRCDTGQVLIEGQNTLFTQMTNVYLSEISDSLNVNQSFRVTNSTVINDNLMIISLPNNIPAGVYFIYVVNGGIQNGPPARNYPLQAPIIVEESPIPGQAEADQTIICSGHTTNIRLVDHVGDIVRWEKSNDGFVNNVVVVPGQRNDAFRPIGIYEDVCYRAIVKKGTCPEAPSQPVCIQVNSPGAGGRVTTSLTEICGGNGQISLLSLVDAQLGQVLNWELSTDNFNTVTTIANSNVNYMHQSPLTQSTCFRAKVVSGQICNFVYSQPVCINVGQQSVGGTAVLRFQNGNCAGDNQSVIRVENKVGNVLYWESSTNNFNTFSRVEEPLDSILVEDLARTTCFRAVVRSGGCPEARSTATCVNVTISSGAGAISGAGTVCAGGSRTLTLTGNQRPILGWESSTDCNTFLNPISIPTNASTINTGNLTVSTCFRAIVQGIGNCPYTYSSSVSVNVSTLKLDTVIVTPVGGCNTLGSIKAIATGGTSPYTYSVTPAIGQPNNTGNFSNVPAGNYIVTVRDGSGCTVSRNITVQAPRLDTLRILNITNISATSATVTWTPAQNPSGGVYRIRYRVAGSVVWTEATTSLTTRILSPLQDGTPYEVEVRFECTGGGNPSPYSTPSAFQTVSLGLTCGSQTTPAPTGIAVTNLTTNSVSVRWSQVLGAGGYMISYGPVSQNPNTYPTLTVCGDILEQTISGLASNTEYQFRVRTICGPCPVTPNSILSNWSAFYSFRTLQLRKGEVEMMENPTADLTVYPNPNKGNFALSFNANEDGQAEILVMDVTGRIVYRQTVNVSAGINELPIELVNVTSGLYSLRFRIGTVEQTSKIIVE